MLHVSVFASRIRTLRLARLCFPFHERTRFCPLSPNTHSSAANHSDTISRCRGRFCRELACNTPPSTLCICCDTCQRNKHRSQPSFPSPTPPLALINTQPALPHQARLFHHQTSPHTSTSPPHLDSLSKDCLLALLSPPAPPMRASPPSLLSLGVSPHHCMRKIGQEAAY